MLCPEVVNFPYPKTCTTITSGQFNSEGAGWRKTIEEHHFNHKVSIVLPNAASLPEPIFNILAEDSVYYKVLNVDLKDLVSKKFIDKFVKRGKLAAISIGTWVDNDDCVAILPTGQLYLSLITDTYQQLGLQGVPSFFDVRKSRKFTISIDMKCDSFTPGKRNYDRVLECLSQRMPQRFNMLFLWEPPESIPGAIMTCPSTLALHFHTLKYEVVDCSPRVAQRRESNVRVPDVSSEEEEVKGALEWLGLFSLQLDNIPSNEYFSCYSCPEPYQEWSKVAYVEWTGLFSSTRILRLLQALRDNIDASKPGLIPWISITVHGFEDSPVSWKQQEHTFQSNGDNLYTFFILPNKSFVLCRMLSSNKRLK